MSQARKMRLVSGLFARKAVNLWASRVAHKSNILLQFSWHSLAQSRSMRLIWFSSPEIWPFLNKIQQSGFGKRVLSLFHRFSWGKELVHFESDDNGGEVRDSDWIGFLSTMFIRVPNWVWSLMFRVWYDQRHHFQEVFVSDWSGTMSYHTYHTIVTTVQFIPVACVSPL